MFQSPRYPSVPFVPSLRSAPSVFPLRRRIVLRALAGLAAFALTSSAKADRFFTFPYGSYTEAPGVVESENQIFGRYRRVDGQRTFGIDVRNEIEFGLGKDFQLGLYAANWNWRNGKGGEPRGFTYESAAVEGKYRIFNEHAGKPFGLAVLGEIAAGRRFFGLEGRLIVDKRIGRWQAAYNLVLESEWSDRNLRTRDLVLGQHAGIRYDVAEHVSVGAEGRFEVIFPNQGKPTEHVFFAGPLATFHTERFYVTASAQFQVTNGVGEPRFFPRVIAGFKF